MIDSIKPSFALATRRKPGRVLRFAEGQRQRQPQLLSVVVEDYPATAPTRNGKQRTRWSALESQVERNTTRTLNLLDELGIKATFFILGWVAERMPQLVYEVAQRGHEVASKGYYRRSIREFTLGEFREDLLRSREVLEKASGTLVLGYRVGDGWFDPEDLWALEILAQEGFLYDSSLRRIFRSFAADPRQHPPHLQSNGARVVWEFPRSTWSLGGWATPIAEENDPRQDSQPLRSGTVADWYRVCNEPLLMHFHVWELDPDGPSCPAVPGPRRIGPYRKHEEMIGMMRDFLGKYRVLGIGEYLIQSSIYELETWLSNSPISGVEPRSDSQRAAEAHPLLWAGDRLR